MDRVYRRAASCPVSHAVRYPPGVTLLTLRRAAHASPVAIALLIVANLVPLIGVLFFDWSLTTIVALYWLENGVVGAFALARMATAEGLDEDPGAVSINGRQLSAAELRNPVSARVVLMPFFVMHYGMFWLVHGVFVWFALPMVWEEMGGATAGPSLVACLWALPVLVLSHAASFVYNWWLGGERYTSSPSREMGAPYGRVVILHVTIVIGAFLVAFLGSPIWALVLLVGLKTVADLAAHLAERRRAGVRARAEGVKLNRTPGGAVWS
jgi:hypothetical protein